LIFDGNQIDFDYALRTSSGSLAIFAAGDGEFGGRIPFLQRD
jgi:hypothetical protein